ncbi:MAG TPA: hypothetical protein VHT94_14330 [Streptosporangiaceae bacterium]|nr:hypothetical protein [Streptosporangiaceae bacterium]
MRGPEPKKALLNIRPATVFRRPGLRTGLRVVAHLTAWLPFVVGPARLIRAGWRPVGDEAAIALRSWNSLTAQGPMVGQATRLAHGVFDPGPLEYWLLAIPVHLDTAHGVVWGAALCCLVACSLAVEAAWSVLGAAGGLCASGLIVGLILWIPGIAVTPSWNPWFGSVFFIAALATAWAVMSGHRGWWPVLVITASIAAQVHLMFTVPSGVLAILALIVGLADSIRGRRGYWWLLAGLIAGAACWSAPLIQQYTSPDGNLGLLLRSSGAATGPRTGGAFSLKALSAAMQPVPIWWKHPAAIYQLISSRSAGFAVAVLVLVAVAAVMAVRPLRCRPLGALALVTVVISLGSLVTYSGIPVRDGTLNTLSYLIVMLFPIGVLSWLVVGSWAVLTGRLVLRHLPTTRLAGRAVPGAAPLAGLAATALVAVGAIVALAPQGHIVRGVTTDPAMASTRAASRQIVRALPGQPIALSIRDFNATALGRLTLGLTWALTPDGFHVEIMRTRYARELGDRYVFRGEAIPLVKVRVRQHHTLVAVTRPTQLASHS